MANISSCITYWCVYSHCYSRGTYVQQPYSDKSTTIMFSTKSSAGACDQSNPVNVLGRSKKCGSKANRQTGQQEPAAVVVFKKMWQQSK